MIIKDSVWRWIPHYRDIPDLDEVGLSGFETGSKVGKDGTVIVAHNIEIDNDQDSIDRINLHDFELRDEANRPWWKFFDDFEYRFNSKVRSRQSRFRWGEKNMPFLEKKLLIKLNILITLYSFVGYWVKYLDQANITNAYVSGMREEIGMAQNDYINAQSMYNAGAVIFQVFFMYLLPRVPLHYLIGGSELIWGFITLAHYAVQTPTQLYALRFLVGAAESGYFILWHFCFSNYFLPTELGLVGGFYYCGQMLGYLTSGLIAGQTSATMEGVGGLSGWRWLFIIDAIITIPVALLGFIMIPGTPYNCYSIFLTDDEVRLARSRLKKANISPASPNPPPFFSKKVWKNIIFDWRIYILSVLDYCFWSSNQNTGGGIALWLKADKSYSIPTLNRLTSIPPALGILFILLVNIGADIYKSRVLSISWAYSLNLIGNVILAIWDVPDSAKWFAFMLGYMSITVSSVIYGWMNDIMRHDAQERAIVLLFTNLFSQQFRAWLDRIVFPTVDAPRYHTGYVYASCHTAGTVVMAFVTLWFYKRQEKKDAKKNGILLYDSTKPIPAEIKRLLDESESSSNISS
ncbi:hypothetical protein G9P44_001836 [Scheffersomyces stipitis]|nr:hypothetical protein G9P44_001836 [Scheffersomyces stipitis]